jgi:hypothetical protein
MIALQGRGLRVEPRVPTLIVMTASIGLDGRCWMGVGHSDS